MTTRSFAIAAALALVMTGAALDAAVGGPDTAPAGAGVDEPAAAPPVLDPSEHAPATAPTGPGGGAPVVAWGHQVDRHVVRLVDLLDDPLPDDGPHGRLATVVHLDEIHAVVEVLLRYPCPDPTVNAPWMSALTQIDAGIDRHRIGYDSHEAAVQRSDAGTDEAVGAAELGMDQGLASFHAGVAEVGVALDAWRTARGIG
jgi:hypothetical protein